MKALANLEITTGPRDLVCYLGFEPARGGRMVKTSYCLTRSLVQNSSTPLLYIRYPLKVKQHPKFNHTYGISLSVNEHFKFCHYAMTIVDLLNVGSMYDNNIYTTMHVHLILARWR